MYLLKNTARIRRRWRITTSIPTKETYFILVASITLFLIICFSIHNRMYQHLENHVTLTSDGVTIEEESLKERPVYHEQYGKGNKKFNPNTKYLIIHPTGRGFSNGLIEMLRGIHIGHLSNRTVLIRKVFMNEHIFRPEQCFSGIPYSKNLEDNELDPAIFRNTKIIPSRLSNVYPISNNVSGQQYFQLFKKHNVKNTFSFTGWYKNVEFIEDYLDDLEHRNFTSCVLYKEFKMRLNEFNCLDVTKNEQIIAIHDSFYMVKVAIRPPVLLTEFLESSETYIKEKLGLEKGNYFTVQVRLGDFVDRGWSIKPFIGIVPNIARLQKEWNLPVVIVTNDPDDRELRSIISKPEYSKWIVTADVYQKNRDHQGNFPILLDIYIASFGKFFIGHKKSTMKTSTLAFNPQQAIAYINELTPDESSWQIMSTILQYQLNIELPGKNYKYRVVKKNRN
jgi:hypothetical protein